MELVGIIVAVAIIVGVVAWIRKDGSAGTDGADGAVGSTGDGVIENESSDTKL